MKKLYRFSLYWGRMGSLSGIFIADDEAVKRATGKTVDFGEALGKHSQVEFAFGDKDTSLTELTDDPNFIEQFERFKCASGHNPFEHLLCPDCDDRLQEPYTNCECGWKEVTP